MSRKRVLSLRCPTCKELVLRTDPEFPFCSERCRLIDLGKWASGGYVISTPLTNPDEVNFQYPKHGSADHNSTAQQQKPSDDSGSKREN